MASKKTQPENNDNLRRIVAESLRLQQEREKTYREQALKLYPHICSWCGREFSGKKLRELTVHHKDYNHDNNPLDGSNWELLCMYCHENMHARKQPIGDGQQTLSDTQRQTSTYQPFANLKALLNQEGSSNSEAIDKDE
jgi:5-methylcytosine-specific restriction endonuclease McrA